MALDTGLDKRRSFTRWNPLGAGSLRRRLAVTYTLALVVGLVLFAALSLATIDRVLENTLDARLATTMRAFAATAAGHVGTSGVDSATVRRLMDELGIAQNGAIVTDAGTVPMQSITIPAAVVAVARRATGASISYATVPQDGGLRVAALPITSGIGGRATLVVWRPIDVIADYERIAMTIFIVASVLIVAAAFAAGIVIVERGLQPLRTMAAIASEIEAHDISRRLSNNDWDDELRIFAATFDRMLERVQSAFARQRQFTADASHDLRAPLAVISAEVDLALTRPRTAIADATSFRSIRDEVREFDRLLQALLLAARADGGPVSALPIDVAELALRATDRLKPLAVSRSVRIRNDVTSCAAIVGDADILERVIVSLLHNGITFSPPDGTVSLCVRDSTRTVSLIVRDEGPGFSDEALKCAFDRFWKDDAARGRSGTGLGLAIAKSAVERAGGSIMIRNTRAGGAEIETVFPIVDDQAVAPERRSAINRR